MFKNLKELVEEIEQGKSNKEIIKERLEYLNSEEYQSELYKRVDFEGTDTPILINGFITKDEIISFAIPKSKYIIPKMKQETNYLFDDEKIYDVIVRSIRGETNNQKAFEEDIFPLELLYYFIDIFLEYYKKSKYSELLRAIKKNHQNGNIRGWFKEIVNEYLYLRSKGIYLTQEEYWNFSEKYYSYCEKKEQNRERDITEEEKDAFKIYERIGLDEICKKTDKNEITFLSAPLNIIDIQGLGIGMCMERAILSQNIFSFLGYNSYLISGKVFSADEEDEKGIEHHTFNVIEEDGKYSIFDSAQKTKIMKMPNVSKPEDLLNFEEMRFGTYFNRDVIYKSAKSTVDRIGSNQNLKQLSKKGKNYRKQTEKFLTRLELYKKLHEEDFER